MGSLWFCMSFSSFGDQSFRASVVQGVGGSGVGIRLCCVVVGWEEEEE